MSGTSTPCVMATFNQYFHVVSSLSPDCAEKRRRSRRDMSVVL